MSTSGFAKDGGGHFYELTLENKDGEINITQQGIGLYHNGVKEGEQVNLFDNGEVESILFYQNLLVS